MQILNIILRIMFLIIYFYYYKNVYENEELLKKELECIYENITQIYFKKYYPPRSYDTTFIRNTNIDKNKLKELITDKIVHILKINLNQSKEQQIGISFVII